MRPTVYLTSIARVTAVRAGGTRFAHEVGPGHAYGIMRRWFSWMNEAVTGHVVSLMPTGTMLDAFKSGSVAFDQYAAELRARWRQHIAAGQYAPTQLRFGRSVALRLEPAGADDARWDGDTWRPLGIVEDGATLCCCCADADRCHRSVAAEVLAASGWRVVLDGVEVRG